VERDERGAVRDLAEERRLVGDLVDGDLAVGPEALEVLGLGRPQVVLLQAADGQDPDLEAQ
ncbi:MAG TPA: hypothetical protein VFU21_23670, partial [Kofleriaceae bacterium]|nr:hypothetical protein [Kofleriaceae bacterium]